MKYFLFWKSRFFPLFSVLVYVLLFYPSEQLLADDSVDCSLYKVPEWEDICNSNSATVFVHDNIPEAGLNAEVDSWGSSPGLHIIPPQTYVLDKKIKLRSQQWMLPNPTSSLPPEKVTRTIELSASGNFSIGSDQYFTMIELSNNVSVGGVEIQGTELTDRIAGYQMATEKNYPRVLVYAPDSIEVVVAGFVLVGARGIDELVWNPFHDDFYWDKFSFSWSPDHTSGMHFLRNHLSVNGSATGFLVSGGHHPPVIQNNSVLLPPTQMDDMKTTGIRVENGASVLEQNDIVYLDESKGSRKRTGIEVDSVEAVVIQANAFYSYGSENDRDIGLWVSANSKWLNLGNNSFSPLIRESLFEGAGHGGANVIENNNYLNADNDSYQFSSAARFLDYPGNLGAFPVASANLVNGFSNSSLLVMPDEPDYDRDSPVQDLIVRAGYYKECPYCVHVFDAVGLSLTLFIGITANIFCCGLGGWSFGARRSPWAPHPR